jgi:hypothetical protein
VCDRGFALSLMIDPWVVAPVLSQPSLPLPLSAAHRADLGISPTELEEVTARVQSGVSVLGLRFTEDRVCPRERFETLRRELDSGFEEIQIDSRPGNPDQIPVEAHSVLTVHLVDQAGHPTYRALERVLGMFEERLLRARAAPPPGPNET